MFNKSLMTFAIAALGATTAWAGVTADEAKQLGTTLTAIGAEKAGNKDGTIPEFTGGLTKGPDGGVEGGKRKDPYASEKPRLVISAKDSAAYADKLTEGTKELLKRYPTMRIDVFPTHRPAHYPKFVTDNALKNATGAKTTDGGLGTENVLPGFPFPIPKTGNEAMWNHLLAYKGLGLEAKVDTFTIDSAGVATLSTTAAVTYGWPIYDPKRSGTVLSPSEQYFMGRLNYAAPARRNGEALLIHDFVSPVSSPRRAWQYLPGQRRVKAAPEVAYDTPNPGWSGGGTYDDASMYLGAMDRYDFKLVGKKEMFIPYGNYKVVYNTPPAEVTKPSHVNPDLVRWELHRVWVVEATLKPGKRHIYAKRVFYIDEDTWLAHAADSYDAGGKLYRGMFLMSAFNYDAGTMWGDTIFSYDFATGSYVTSALLGGWSGVKVLKDMPAPTFFTADALAGAGVR